ncbi:hypothetical protein LPB19_16185 [Marinobacter salinisoli]|uniref:Carotenoid 1,2-hydratase n=1 Tax=Marinobacter salinisoli TaxID=2769486 RepID=A0ABX7MR52_9GAMM|nr:DUF6544 family protein [Marinobacter salinisoli]QSP94688.1 hypothetical protein LPB19_16185 [Marinobacter salinisoli]
MSAVTVVLVGLLATGLSLCLWRRMDHRADHDVMHSLAVSQPDHPPVFSADMVADLPDPARRFFMYSIEPGTPLLSAARITMAGRFGMGDRENPDYLCFSATQVLAMPQGFVWKMHARRGLMGLSGSDSHRWTRFWLIGFVPVARLGGDSDHTLSAFGRYVAEAIFWTPAAVLPRPEIVWEAIDADSARVTVSHRGMSQSVDLTVGPDGQPLQVRFQRWSNANPEQKYQWQPFGGYLSEFRHFGGFRLPTHVEAGNQFATDRYFPFFVADVTSVEFLNGDA